jgi:hypothetical protein
MHAPAGTVWVLIQILGRLGGQLREDRAHRLR